MTRPSTSSTTSATPRSRRRGPSSSCSSSPAGSPRSGSTGLEAAVGELARRGLGGRWLCADLQDPPFARRRRLGRRPRDGPARPTREPQEAGATELEPWRPNPEPTPAELVAAGVRGLVTTSAELLARALAAATRPASSLGALRDAIEGVGEIVWAGLNPAPVDAVERRDRPAPALLGGAPGARRVQGGQGRARRDGQRRRADRRLRRAGALAALARDPHRGARDARAGTGLGTRERGSAPHARQPLTAMRGPLPVYIKDPVARLRFVRQAMDGLKESKQAVGAATLARVNNLAPPTILAQASRLQLLDPAVQPAGDQHPGTAVPALRAGPPAQGSVPGRVPARQPRAGDRDHVLRRRARLSACSATTTRCPTSSVIADGIEASLHEFLEAARGQRTARQAAPRASRRSEPARRRPCRSSARPPANAAHASARPPILPSARAALDPRAGRRHARQAGPAQETVTVVLVPRAAGWRDVTPSRGLRSPRTIVAPDGRRPDRADEIAYRLELTAAQLKIVHTALKSLFDDLGHDERDVKDVVAAVLESSRRARDPRDRPRARAARRT